MRCVERSCHLFVKTNPYERGFQPFRVFGQALSRFGGKAVVLADCLEVRCQFRQQSSAIRKPVKLGNAVECNGLLSNNE